MPTPKKGARLGGSASHQRKILSNLAAQLIEHEAITTTDSKAKMLRPYVEKIITKAKAGTLADRRNVLKLIPNKDVVSYLFEELGPRFENRDGGYTRTIKVENRKGDNAPMSRISLVLEETVTSEATRATRVAASKKAADDKADEAAKADADKAEEAPKAKADKADEPAEAEATEAPKADEASAEDDK